MTGFLDRLLHADKPQPLDVDTAAAMLSTTPGLLREFERSYHANVLDRKNAPTGPLGPDAKTVVESRSGHGLSDEALALDARIVRELLSDTGVIRFDGERLTTIPALAPVPEKYVTESDVNALQTGERPQLAGELIHRQIDAVNYPLLLDMWRRATDPKRSARQRHEAYGMFRTGLDLLDLDPVMYRMLDMNPASIGHWLPALVKANEGKTFFRIPKTTIAKAPLTLLQLSRVEYESLTAATLDVVDRWAQAAFRLKPDESYFLKTGTFSNKYDFRNAHVTEPHEVMQIGEYLLYLQSQAVEMAGPLSQPATYGVSTTNEMVVREYIPDTHDLPTIYMGLPLRCEYRCFIDCDTDELLGIHPYWDPKVMNHRFRDWPDSDNPHMRVREDWREQAARLEAAARILPDPHVRVAGRSYGGPDPMTLAHYGVVRIRPYMDQLTLPASNVDRWDLIPALRPFLGRDVQSVPCDGDAIDVAARGMLDRHPGAGVVVKFMLREKRLPLAFIDPDGTFEQSDEYGGKPERIPFAAWRWAGYDLALFEGKPDAVLVQQRVRMRYEYRVQVIGGEPVCGAGCIERFTPADNRGNRYDPRMEETRNSGRIESHPDIARLYEAFAHEAAHAIRGEVEGPYVMDLYLDDAGQPHVIELNPQSNSGLYALDMDALLTAIRDNPEQFMPDPSRSGMPGCLGVREESVV